MLVLHSLPDDVRKHLLLHLCGAREGKHQEEERAMVNIPRKVGSNLHQSLQVLLAFSESERARTDLEIEQTIQPLLQKAHGVRLAARR